MAHGLETLVSAAEQLQSTLPQALFLLIGEGAEKEAIVKLASARELTNIRFLNQQPREKIPSYISMADVCLVLLKRTELFKTVIPTKLLEYMSCERPVIVAVDGQTRKLVQDAGAGVFVTPEDHAALAAAIAALYEDANQRFSMGRRGREFIVARLSRERTAVDYLTVLKTLMPAAKPDQG
jgi:glycosyltransferase involved in cell wall biosynthesis